MQKSIKISFILIGLIILSISVSATTWVVEQNYSGGTTKVNTISTTDADATKFTANRSYSICGFMYEARPSGGTFNMSLWSHNAGSNQPQTILHTFTLAGENNGVWVKNFTTNCYSLTNGVTYWLVVTSTGSATGESYGVTTGGTGWNYASNPYTWGTTSDLTYRANFATFSILDEASLTVSRKEFNPSQNAYNDNATLQYLFNFTALPSGTVANCSLFFNNSVYTTRTNLQANTYHGFNVSQDYNFVGNKTVYVNCTGNNSVNAVSSNWYTYWNLTKTLNVNWNSLSPLNYTYNTNSSLKHYFNITGINLSTANCSLYWNGSIEASTNNVATGQNWYLEVMKASPLYINATTYINCTSDLVTSSLSSTKYIAWNLTSPSVVLQDKSPDDITSTSGFAQTILFNYTYTYFGLINNEFLNLSTVKLNYKLNDSVNSCITYLNGSLYNCNYQSKNYFANVSYELFRFMMTDNDVLPATYNLNETYVENTLHGATTLTSDNQFYKIELLNISNSTRYGFYEVMLNITSGTESPVQVFYCNSTYTTGSLLSSSNCVQFGTIATPYNYNHSHSAFSKHHLVPMAIVNGSLSGIKVTSRSYFIIRGINTKTVSVYNVAGYVRPNAMATTGNNGVSWTEITTSVVDSHVHQFNSDATFYYYAQGYYNKLAYEAYYNSSILYDVLDLGGLPPDSPVIHYPLENILYKGIINVNYSFGASPMGLSVIYSNISLRNIADDSWNYTIVANNTPNTNYSWNSSSVPDGSYNVRVYNCDSTMICSFSEVNNITIDNTAPIIKINEPVTNYLYFNNPFFSVKGNITDAYTTMQWWTNNSGVTNTSVSLTPPEFNILATWAEGLTVFTIYANDTIGNINSSTRRFFVDTTLPVITSTYPAEDNSSWKYGYQSVTFNNTCYTPNNISEVRMSCYNSSDDLVFSDTDAGLSTYLTYNYLNTTNTINYQDEFTCRAECDSLSAFYNISEDYKIFVIDILSWENYTNLSETKINHNFAFDVTYDFNGDNHRCFVYTNSSSVSCNSSIGTGTLSLGCTISASTEESIEMFLDCSDLDMGIYNVTPVDTKIIFIDIVKPELTIYSPNLTNNNVRLKNNTVFQWNITSVDNNVFAFELNCSKSGITQYYDKLVDINSTSFSYTNYTYFQTPGLYNCNVSASDDHTDKKFDEDTKLDKGNIFTDKIKGNVGKVDFELSKEDNMKVELLKSTDRVSLEMKFDNPKKEIKTKVVKIKCADGYNLYKRSTNPKYKEHWVCADGLIGYWSDGNTIEDIDSVNSYVDKKTGELIYEYKTKGDKITMNSIGGLNFNSILFNITIDYWENVSFYAYNIYNGSNIYNFNVNITNSTGSSNIYSTSTRNITVNLLNGTYTIIQNATSYFRTQTYTYTTNNDSFFNKSFWQAELTASIRNVQDDSLVGGTTLTIQNDSILYTNTTNPATFLLNSNTDYIVNVTGNGITPNSTNYTIISNGAYVYTFYVYANFTLFIKDEATKDFFNISSPSSINQYIFCDDDSIIITIVNETTSSFTPPCQFLKIKYIVNYPTDRYYRVLLPRAFNLTTGNVTIWLINLDTTQTVFNTWELFSLNEYYENFRVYFKKFIDTEEFIITSDYLDVEDKIGTYLMLGEEYTIEVEADNIASRTLGFYSADAAGDKVLRLFDIYYNPTDIAGYYTNNSWYVSVDNTTDPDRVKVTYLSDDVSTATLNVYNGSKTGSLLYTTTTTGDSGIIYYAPTTAYENYTFLVELNITKNDGSSTNTTFSKFIRTNSRIALDIITMGFVTEEFLFMFIAILLSVVALAFSISTSSIGGIIFIGLGGLFYWLGWFYMSTGVLGLAIIVAVGSFLKNKDLGVE